MGYIEIIPGVYVYSFGKVNADREEPICMRCEHCSGEDFYCNRCGPEFGWNNYSRESVQTDEDDRPIYYNEQKEKLAYDDAIKAIIAYHKNR